MIRASIHLQRDGFTLDANIETDTHVVGIFGPSGAGKTTLINIIAGLLRPDRGSVVVEGETLFDSSRGIDLPAHRRRIGVVFQEHRLFPHLSVKGNLIYGQPRPQRDNREREFLQIIDLLELGDLLKRRISQISGGERQRVALGRALISRPSLLLLDEPLASLDQRLKQQIIPYLQRVRDVSAIPTLYVSHDLSEILQLTDRLIVLERGRLIGQGRYTDLVHDNAVLVVVHDRGMRNVLNACVVRHEPSDGVSVLQLGSVNDPVCQLIVPQCAAPSGATVTIAVQPWDVALATEPVHPVSIQNQIRGIVRRCTLHESRAIVDVDIGTPLIVEVSRRSAVALELTAGRPIVCLIKSNAIRHIGGG